MMQRRYFVLSHLMSSLTQMEQALQEIAEQVENAEELQLCTTALLAVRRKFWPMYRQVEQEKYEEAYPELREQE